VIKKHHGGWNGDETRYSRKTKILESEDSWKILENRVISASKQTSCQ
jgi:hypothetical protein